MTVTQTWHKNSNTITITYTYTGNDTEIKNLEKECQTTIGTKEVDNDSETITSNC